MSERSGLVARHVFDTYLCYNIPHSSLVRAAQHASGLLCSPPPPPHLQGYEVQDGAHTALTTRLPVAGQQLQLLLLTELHLDLQSQTQRQQDTLLAGVFGTALMRLATCLLCKLVCLHTATCTLGSSCSSSLGGGVCSSAPSHSATLPSQPLATPPTPVC